MFHVLSSQRQLFKVAELTFSQPTDIPSFYGKPHGYSSRSDSTRKAVARQTSPKINRLC